MRQRRGFLVVAAGLLGLSPLFFSGSKAADGGASALPRREDVSYRLPGVDAFATNTLSWQPKVGDLPAFSAYYDSVTPSAWQSGPVYSGLTWFWREEGLPGTIDFVGYADASLDSTFYTTPVQWLPLDPVAAGSWGTIATDSKGSTYTFDFSYDGFDTLIAGTVQRPDTLVCWRIILRQTLPASALKSGRIRDGMGLLRATMAGSVTDTLWYEAGTMPRRRVAYRDDFPQNELLYRSHLTRDTPVSSRRKGTGLFKSGWQH